MTDFDPAKEAINFAKHGISLARWVDLDVLAIVRDDRFDYGEPRFRAYGLLDGEPHCLVFTTRDRTSRPISLRRAHTKEFKRYVT
jgi:uncharacterized DUF497 family protein